MTVAYSCPFVPPEWIAAHGLQPRRIVPNADGAGALPGLCPYAGAFARAAADWDAAVFTTACDQMRRVFERHLKESSKPGLLMHVPATWQSPAAQGLYRDELRRLGRFLESLGGRAPTAEGLRAIVLRYEAGRLALKAARGNMSERAWRSALAHFFATGQAVATGEEPRPEGVALMLLGGPLPPERGALFDVVERAGGWIAVDGTETGERTWPALVDARALQKDPLETLAAAYFDGIAEAFRRPNTLLYEWLEGVVAERGIRGILLHRFPWCDTWHGEAARIREVTGLPVLELETEGGPGADERGAGRVEAFLEMLRC